MKTTFAAFVIALVFIGSPAFCEIEKVADVCQTGLCLKWWPKIGKIAGWHQDEVASHQNAINVQVPDGSTFANAVTIIYAKANYKPRTPETKSLDDLINSDKKEFLSQRPEIVIKDAPPLVTGDGKAFKSVVFFPEGKGDWEEVAYGEEGDYYLIFTISSRTKEGFEKSFEVFKTIIGRYKEKPEPDR